MKYFSVFFFCLTGHFVWAQVQFFGLNSLWDNSYSEWEISYVNDEEEIERGYLQRKWPLRNNWEEWTYELGDYYGEVKTKWKGQQDNWELRSNNKIIDIKRRWRNDVNEWKISHNRKSILLKTEYYNDANTWIAEYSGARFIMFTEYMNDPRDWIIEDELYDMDHEHKLAIMFIALFQSIPK